MNWLRWFRFWTFFSTLGSCLLRDWQWVSSLITETKTRKQQFSLFENLIYIFVKQNAQMNDFIHFIALIHETIILISNDWYRKFEQVLPFIGILSTFSMIFVIHSSKFSIKFHLNCHYEVKTIKAYKQICWKKIPFLEFTKIILGNSSWTMIFISPVLGLLKHNSNLY